MNIYREFNLYKHYDGLQHRVFKVQRNYKGHNNFIPFPQYPFMIEVYHSSGNSLNKNDGCNYVGFESEQDARDMALILTLSS